jgi:dTDP-4-amino-4,6-dideoxygalactose transaminase
MALAIESAPQLFSVGHPRETQSHREPLMSTSSRVAMKSATESLVATPVQVDFLDLRAQFATIREEIVEAVTNVLESQQFILGSEVKAFEEETAALLGARHAVACASGSDALALALMAAEIGPGDEVITTPFTYVATAGSIARVGATPVFVDIEPGGFNINPLGVKGAVSARTRAILPVHLFGLSADLDPILRAAGEQGIAVIEDAAQAINARYGDRCVGTIGTFGCFSFFPSKNLGGAGDGGLVTTENPALAERLRMLRVHGSRKKYHHEILGMNSRLDALQAAILRIKLRRLESWTRAREARAARYRKLFGEMGLAAFVQAPPVPNYNCRYVYNQFTIRCQSRDALRESLRKSGIQTEIYYPLPLHLQPAFEYLGYRAGQCPEAERASQEALSLPVYPELTDQQQDAVVLAIAAFFNGKAF